MFEDKIKNAESEMRRRVDAHTRADELLGELGLANLEPLVSRATVWQDGNWETNRTNPDWPYLAKQPGYRDDGRAFVHVSLYIPWEHREEAREIVLGQSSVDRWIKGYEISEGNFGRSNYLLERWRWEEEHEIGESHDRVDIEFYRSVEIGDKINGCEVTVLETSTRLKPVLSCSLGKNNGRS